MRFNGATSFQTWKSVKDGWEGGLTWASMGPRLFRRGNVDYCARLYGWQQASMGPRLFRRGNKELMVSLLYDALLQWGHVFSDVEISLLPTG